MGKSIKNYTTAIKAEKSINEIESILARFGAQSIFKMYGNDREPSNTFPPTEVGGFSATKPVLPDWVIAKSLRYFRCRNPTMIRSVVGSFVAL